MSRVDDNNVNSNKKIVAFLKKIFPKWYLFHKQKFISNFILFLLLVLAYFTIFGASVVFGNAYFYILTVPKALIALNPAFIYFSITASNAELIEEWKSEAKRKNLILRLSNFIMTAIVGIFLLSFLWLWFLEYSYKNGGPLKLNENFISYYNPTILEKALIFSIFALTLICSYIVMYWFTKKFVKIVDYNEKAKKINTTDRYILGLLILFSPVFLFLMIDLAIVQYLGGGSFKGTEWLPGLVARAKNWLLGAELLLLAAIIAFFIRGIISDNKSNSTAN